MYSILLSPSGKVGRVWDLQTKTLQVRIQDFKLSIGFYVFTRPNKILVIQNQRMDPNVFTFPSLLISNLPTHTIGGFRNYCCDRMLGSSGIVTSGYRNSLLTVAPTNFICVCVCLCVCLAFSAYI